MIENPDPQDRDARDVNPSGLPEGDPKKVPQPVDADHAETEEASR